MSAPTPNHTPCRHCGVPISWDEYCWTHDNTGFADCGLLIRGGLRTDLAGLVKALDFQPVPFVRSGEFILDPHISLPPTDGTTALPIGEWS